MAPGRAAGKKLNPAAVDRQEQLASELSALEVPAVLLPGHLNG